MNMLTLTPKKNGVAGGTAKKVAGRSAIGSLLAIGNSRGVAKVIIIVDSSATSIVLIGDSSATSEAIIIRRNEFIRTQTLDSRGNNKNYQPYGTAATDTSKPHGVYLTQRVGAVCCGLAS